MNTRVVLGIAVMLATSCACFGQSPQGDDVAGVSAKQQLKKNVAADEAAVRTAETAHATDVQLARLYWHLGFSYEDAAEFGRSEAALAHSVSLFRRVPDDNAELATALNSLAVLHIGMEKVREANKEEGEAVKLRENLADRLQLAESWNTLAALSLKRHKYRDARDLATNAIAEYQANAKADPSDMIAAKYALGMSLCGLKDCLQGVQVFEDALAEARAKLPPNDYSISTGQYLLGLAYWKSGDMASAGRELQAGVTAMSRQLGPEYPSYVFSLELYAKYLRQARQVEAAKDVERQIQQANAVVDVRSLQSGVAALGFDAMR